MALLIAAAISLPAADISVAAMRGPTAMGLAGLMDKAAAGPVDGNSYSFTLEGSPDAVVPLIVRGDADIAAIPANLASVLYNRTEGGVVALAVNTLGVLYIVENGDTVHSVDDLRGRTIYSAGKGATPEYSLLYILSQSGLEPGKDVYIEWKSEHAECVAALASDPDGVAMLPQPFATTAMMKDSSIRIALDVNSIWEDLTGVGMITGVTVARRGFAEENPEAVASFLAEYAESVAFCNASPDAPRSIASYSIVPEPVAQLDPYHARQTYEVLRDLNENHGKTIIVIEHHTDFIAEYCSSAALMHDGAIAWTLPAHEALQRIEDLEASDVHPPQIALAGRELQRVGALAEHAPLPTTVEEGFAAFANIPFVPPHSADCKKQAEASSVPAVSFRDVDVSYRSVKGEPRNVFRGLDLDIRQGEKIALVGSNGAGKEAHVRPDQTAGRRSAAQRHADAQLRARRALRDHLACLSKSRADVYQRLDPRRYRVRHACTRCRGRAAARGGAARALPPG